MFMRYKQSSGAQTPNASLAAARERPEDVEQVLMDIQNGSKLAISWMPTFRYQPRWSWNCRPTVGQVLEVKGSKLLVRFDASEHPSPPMAWYTTFIDALWPLMVPALPPGVSIDIKSNELKGWIDLATGEVDLNFSSNFDNLAFGKAATKEPLKVDSRMTTEALHGHIFQAIGRRIMDDASAVLVALSAVPVTSDDFQNWLLKLPTDALSVLNVKLTFVMKKPTAAAVASAPSQPQAQSSTM